MNLTNLLIGFSLLVSAVAVTLSENRAISEVRAKIARLSSEVEGIRTATLAIQKQNGDTRRELTALNQQATELANPAAADSPRPISSSTKLWTFRGGMHQASGEVST